MEKYISKYSNIPVTELIEQFENISQQCINIKSSYAEDKTSYIQRMNADILCGKQLDEFFGFRTEFGYTGTIKKLYDVAEKWLKNLRIIKKILKHSDKYNYIVDKINSEGIEPDFLQQSKLSYELNIIKKYESEITLQ